MKKLIYSVAALAAMALAGSCQQENIGAGVKGGVTYTISLPEAPQTKGNSGYAEYTLYYEVYKTIDAAELESLTKPLFEGEVEMTGNTYDLTLNLLNDQDYTVLFWATKKGEADTYFTVGDLRNVGIKTALSNNNDRDAFCGMDQLDDFDGVVTRTVYLKRPFAQLNIATLIPDVDYDLIPKRSYVRVTSIPTAYNVATGEQVGTDTEVVYDFADVPAGKKLSANVGGVTSEYDLVAMNYLLVPEATIEVYYQIETASGTVNNTITNVPVQANHRTNIVGNLLTSNATYNIVIEPGFLDIEGGNMEVLPNGVIRNINGDYEITTAAGLAWAVDNLFDAGGDFYLYKDVNLSDVDYTPANPGSSVVLNLYGEKPVVTRSTASNGVTISGLKKPLINENNGSVRLQGINVKASDEAEDGLKLINVNHKTLILNDVESEGMGLVGTNNAVIFVDSVTVPEDEEIISEGNEVTELGSITTADMMVAALEAGESVVLAADIKIDPANMSNAYGATGVNVKYGQTIDGGGHTLDIKGAGGTWDSGINTTGGLIKNITVTGSFRGIFINHNSTYSETVKLDNVTINGTVYTISCDQGMNQNFEAVNSKFYGWTSYAATIGTAKFDGCTFGEGSGYAYCRPYAPTEFVNCTFEAGYTMDPRAAVTFENCTFDGVAITADNLSDLVTDTTKVTLK